MRFIPKKKHNFQIRNFFLDDEQESKILHPKNNVYSKGIHKIYNTLHICEIQSKDLNRTSHCETVFDVSSIFLLQSLELKELEIQIDRLSIKINHNY